MKKFLRGADGRFKGSRRAPAKAPTPRLPRQASQMRQRDCLADDSPGVSVAASAWRDGSHGHARVVPQRSIASSPNLKQAREVLGAEHSHVEAIATIRLGHRTVQERLLAVGLPCAIPQRLAPQASTSTPADTPPALSSLLDKGIWRIEPHPTIPETTIVRSPAVTNNDEGWAHVAEGLKYARGPRILRAQVSLVAIAHTPLQPPPPPPEGFVPIRGLKRLVYAG